MSTNNSSSLRSLAHLEEQLGHNNWLALINPANTGKVKQFVEGLLKSELPSEMTIGGVVYDILSLHKEGEKSIKNDVMVTRAKEMNAHQGNVEFAHIFEHLDDIPVTLRGKITFVFTDYLECVRTIHWMCGSWIESGAYDWEWSLNCRVLRRKYSK